MAVPGGRGRGREPSERGDDDRLIRLRFEGGSRDPHAELVEGILEEAGLARIVAHLGLDRAALAELGVQRDVALVMHSATAPDIAPIPTSVKLSEFPWMLSRLLQGDVIRFSRREDLPVEAHSDRRRFAELGTRSLAAMPLRVGAAAVGVLAFSTVRAERQWPDELVHRLQLQAEVFGNALAPAGAPRRLCWRARRKPGGSARR